MKREHPYLPPSRPKRFFFSPQRPDRLWSQLSLPFDGYWVSAVGAKRPGLLLNAHLYTVLQVQPCLYLSLVFEHSFIQYCMDTSVKTYRTNIRASAAGHNETSSHDCLSFFQHNSYIFRYSSYNGHARKIAGYKASVITSKINSRTLSHCLGCF
jgi:hypothetical protein